MGGRSRNSRKKYRKTKPQRILIRCGFWVGAGGCREPRRKGTRVAAPSGCIVPWAARASCWPQPQQLLPVSAAGSGRRCCTGAFLPAGLFGGSYELRLPLFPQPLGRALKKRSAAPASPPCFRRRQTGCGTQHPLRLACVSLAAAPTTPRCFRRWRRSSSLQSAPLLFESLILHTLASAALHKKKSH